MFIDGNNLTINQIIDVARNNAKVQISDEAKNAINHSRDFVEKIVEEHKPVYGINTGFGKFCNVSISKSDLKLLQKNLIMSHACGVGNPLSVEVVRAIMLLRANALSKGFSGIRLSTIQRLIDFLNLGITPVIPEKGSLGASGDLAPLSHMVLPMIGLGEAYFEEKKYSGEEILKKFDLMPLELSEKEGLALINGTQVMTAIGSIALYDAINILKTADLTAAMTMEALNGITDAFYPKVHEIRNQKGQLKTAENILKIVEGSKNVTAQTELKVQDAYSIRCVPQVHGASKDAIEYVEMIINREINAVTDNPIVLSDEGKVISAGNFHGQPVALAMDFFAIAISEIANISERRIERMVNPQLSGLAPFLSKSGGLNSGFMIPQYAAAALVSENKVLAHPASVDSIPSSANQEDHVSMGTIAARKGAEILFNTSKVLSIELLTAVQAVDIAECADKLSPVNKKVYDLIREKVSYMEKDRVIYPDIESCYDIIKSEALITETEKIVGNLY
jgi:histidine ammonia-lyase